MVDYVSSPDLTRPGPESGREAKLIEEAISRFLLYLRAEQGCAKNTVLAYQTDLRQFKRAVSGDGSRESVRVRSLDGAAVRSFLSWVGSREYRPSTVARKLAAVRSFLRYLGREEGLVEADLVDKVPAPSSDRSRPRVLSRAEVDHLQKTASRSITPAGTRDAAILALLYATGLKPAQAVSLDVEDINLEAGLLHFEAQGAPARPLRTAYLPLAIYLESGRPQLARGRANRALFLNPSGGRLSRQGMWLAVKRWAATAGLGDEVTPYTLRHSYISHRLQEGYSKQEVQAELGLSSPNSIRLHERLGPHKRKERADE